MVLLYASRTIIIWGALPRSFVRSFAAVRLLRLRALFAFQLNVKQPRGRAGERASDERLERQENDAGNRGRRSARSPDGALTAINYWSMERGREEAISFRNARVLVMVTPDANTPRIGYMVLGLG